MRTLSFGFFAGCVAGTRSEECSVPYSLKFLCKLWMESLPALLSEGAVLGKAMIIIFSAGLEG